MSSRQVSHGISRHQGSPQGSELGSAFCGIYRGFPGGSDGKDSTCNAEELGSISGLGRCPGGGHGDPFQNSRIPREFYGQRSLGSDSPTLCSTLESKELDMTESTNRGLEVLELTLCF